MITHFPTNNNLKLFLMKQVEIEIYATFFLRYYGSMKSPIIIDTFGTKKMFPPEAGLSFDTKLINYGWILHRLRDAEENVLISK